ncbi:MAG: AEC family transporter [Deinococcota bacterium]
MFAVFSTLFNVVLPAFVIMAIGGLIGYYLKLDIKSINRLALYSTTPALIFNSLSRTTLEPANVGRLLAAFFTMFIGMFVVSSLASLRLPASARRGVIASSMFVNSANLMFPVTLFAIGDAGVERALVLYVTTTVLLYIVCPIIFSEGASPRKLVASVLSIPVVWAALAAFTFNMTGWSLPLGIGRGVELLAGAAIPLVLLVLGMQIQRTGLPIPSRVNWLASGLRLLVGPCIAFAAAYGLGLRDIDLAVVTLFGAMPPAVMVFMLALEFSDNAEEVARTVVFSTLSALISVSMVVTLIQPML